MHNAQWTMHSAQWTMHNGRWTFTRLVGNIKTTSITLAPNPCTNELNIQNVQGLSTEVILDVFGKEILKSVSTSIDVSALQSGIYFVHLLTEKGIVQKQFIKQ